MVQAPNPPPPAPQGHGLGDKMRGTSPSQLRDTSVPVAPRRSEAENFWNGFLEMLVQGFLGSSMIRHQTADMLHFFRRSDATC